MSTDNTNDEPDLSRTREEKLKALARKEDEVGEEVAALAERAVQRLQEEFS